jgi:hypothetical protein
MQTVVDMQRAQAAFTSRRERCEGMEQRAGIESAAETDDDATSGQL